MEYDIVYLWVDDQDPIWKNKKKQYEAPQEDLVPYGDDASRYRNNNELYYSLRSMRRYARDVNKVYLVTDHQVPSWIDEFPEVQCVFHDQILECTPIFNTRAILNQVHKISDLLEHFIIMNDDIYFNKTMGFEDFFHNDQVTVFIENGYVNHDDGRAHHSRARYVQNVLDIPCNYVFAHAAIPVVKSQYLQWVEKYSDLYHRVNHQRFRQNTGVAIQFLYHYDMLYRHPWCAHVMKTGYYESHTLNEEVVYRIKHDNAAFICINDTWGDEVPEEQYMWLQHYYKHV